MDVKIKTVHQGTSYFPEKDNTSAFLISGSKRRFTKMYHNDSPALGRTYKASSPRLAFFSNNTERADSPPASQ